MVAIGEPELALLRRVVTELRGKLVPEDPATTVMAVKLCQAGYLEDHPDDPDAFGLTELAREYLGVLLG